MIALNSWIPNMPKLEMVNVPPCALVSAWDSSTRRPRLTWYSSGFSLPSRAFPASDLTSDEIVAKPLLPTSLTIGVIKPLGVATATQISAFLYLEMTV